MPVVWVAAAYGGWVGLALFVFQACIAIWQLELVSCVEHCGLSRKHIGNGKYEPQKPHHSRNAAHRASNRLLINRQRPADHHDHPDRRYLLHQTYASDEVPRLPYGYSVMTTLALIPPLWRRLMKPRVRKLRAQFYPEITSWRPYNKLALPMPL